MNIPDLLLPQSLLWPANLAAVLLLAACIRHVPRQRLKAGLLHLWLVSCVALMLVWSIKAGIKPGLDFHLLGATLLTLMFGPCLAIVALAVVLVGVTLAGTAGWMSLGINLLIMAALPVLFSYAVYSQAHYKLPRHVFVYVFLDAFFTAGLAICLSGVTAILVLAGSGAYTLQFLGSNYLTYFILMGWPEALLTGMAAMLMVVYRPQWLATFSDELYLRNK
ncbi:MAG TPA: energy-coupling factor ABC transporter permease [Novimethylophilus sp.]|jgi:uncharacterized membrane protein|uniref:energy-coupling factor ABC transporter permease n=1 Tax=Novimethylophilus sp. TaxID=2137426 RepID=UPI002F409D01